MSKVVAKSSAVIAQQQVKRHEFPTVVRETAEVDTSWLTQREKLCIAHLIKAGKIIDNIYYLQVSKDGWGIKSLLEDLSKLAKDMHKRRLTWDISEYLYHFNLNRGPWHSANSNKKMIPNFTAEDLGNLVKEAVEHKSITPARAAELTKLIDKHSKLLFNPSFMPQKPKGAELFPPGATSDLINNALGISSKKNRARFRKSLDNEYSVIQLVANKDGSFSFKAVRFEKLYAEYLKQVAQHLRDAAKFADDQKFKEFLLARANTMLKGDYNSSDVLWLHYRGRINLSIGPIETYDDTIRGKKTSYQCHIYIQTPENMKKAGVLQEYVREMESRLPCSDEYKNLKRPLLEPDLVDMVAMFGAFSGVTSTVAFTLPNDEKLLRKHGAKVTQSTNVAPAKQRPMFAKVIRRFLPKGILNEISLEEFRDADNMMSLLHEYSHPMGNVKKSLLKKGIDTRIALKDAYGSIEEMKAEVLGRFHVPFLVEKGVLNDKTRRAIYLISIIQELRKMYVTGLGPAHADAQAIPFNYQLEHGGIFFNKDGRMDVNVEKFERNLRKLAAIVLKIEGEGDYAGAQRFLAKYKYIDPKVAKLLKRMNDIPKVVDLYFDIGEFENLLSFHGAAAA